MALVKGPWELKWGNNTLLDIEEISVDYEQDSEDYTTVQHQTYQIDGAIKASVSLTLLASDISALAVVLPQYHVANGEILSTGETVSDANGAIDVVAQNCGESVTYGNLDIISCANPGQVYRLVNARTKLEGVEFDDKVRKVTVQFIGESASDEASIQFFTEGTIAVVS